MNSKVKPALQHVMFVIFPDGHQIRKRKLQRKLNLLSSWLVRQPRITYLEGITWPRGDTKFPFEC